MSQLRQSKPLYRRRPEREDWEEHLEDLSRRLCTPHELLIHKRREQLYTRNGLSRVALFPVWRRYRWQAQKIAKLHRIFPILKRLPLSVSRFLCELIFQ